MQKKEDEAQQIRTGSVKREVPAFIRSPIVAKFEPVSQKSKDKDLLFREAIDISDGSKPSSIIKSKVKSPMQDDLPRLSNIKQSIPTQQV